ncbi:MAG TPA: cation diffusion facilitator family transporter [Bryobacteraceae bacterium]|nr:cation diffusion facilitator family transporter [Bryobacteraceae bacterium]
MAAPERVAARVALIGVATSAALAALKIIVGLAAHSVAVISDGIESATDVFSSGLVWVGLRVAAKPADKEHPYGHGRFEILTGLAIGLLLAAVGAGICVRSLVAPHERHAPALFAVWAVLVSIAAKAGLAIAKMRVGRRIRSAALQADAWNDTVDLLSGIVALIAVLLSVLVPGWHAADSYGGFAIGLIVIFLGLRVARETALQLMDTMPDETQMQQIRAAALRVPGALGIEKCFARKTGLRYHVDLHLEVDPGMTVMASHGIAHAVQLNVKTELDWVEDVLVHVEPHLNGRGQEPGARDQ